MPAHDVFQSVATEPRSPSAWEQWIFVGTPPFLQPGFQNPDGFPLQRCGAMLAALALTANVSPGARNKVATSQTCNLRCPQARLQRNQQDRMVATADPRRAIGRGQESVNFIAIEELDHSPDISLSRHCQYLPAVLSA